MTTSKSAYTLPCGCGGTGTADGRNAHRRTQPAPRFLRPCSLSCEGPRRTAGTSTSAGPPGVTLSDAINQFITSSTTRQRNHGDSYKANNGTHAPADRGAVPCASGTAARRSLTSALTRNFASTQPAHNSNSWHQHHSSAINITKTPPEQLHSPAELGPSRCPQAAASAPQSPSLALTMQ